MVFHRVTLIENVKIDQNLGILQSTPLPKMSKKIILMAVGTLLLRGGGDSSLTLTVSTLSDYCQLKF